MVIQGWRVELDDVAVLLLRARMMWWTRRKRTAVMGLGKGAAFYDGRLAVTRAARTLNGRVRGL